MALPDAPLRVYFHGDISTAHVQRMLQGAAEFGNERVPRWFVRWGNFNPTVRSLRREEYRAFLFFSVELRRAREIARCGIPMVRLGSIFSLPEIPAVLPDNHAIGRMAWEHFQEMFFSRLAFVGPHGHGYSRERYRGFVAAAPSPVETYWMGRQARGSDQRELARWIARLPARTAIFAANDIFARRVVETCLAAGRSVPHDLAVLGVDDDPLVVLSSEVPLSSVDPNSKEIGRRAAAKVARILEAGALPAGEREERVPPAGVVLRASTDTLATDDDKVAGAARIMREEACSGITVTDICRRIGLGRRNFEMRFHQVVGHSPAAQLRDLRMARAQSLLESSQLSVQEVAFACGFNDQLYFSSAFKKVTGQSPKHWRETQRKGRR